MKKRKQMLNKGAFSMVEKEKVYIVCFSGGKDSTAMLFKLIENNYPITEIISCDTSVEHEEMYEHIDKVKGMIPYPMTILKSDKDFNYYITQHPISKGKRKGEVGYGWSTNLNRWCTTYLKTIIVDEYVEKKYPKEKYHVVRYLGIAIDEAKRLREDEHKAYPLVDFQMTEKDCLEYCYSLGLDWGGLYEIYPRLSCWCCPLQRLGTLEWLYFNRPHLWEQLRVWDEYSHRPFRKDYTLAQLEEKFEKKRQEYETKEEE